MAALPGLGIRHGTPTRQTRDGAGVAGSAPGARPGPPSSAVSAESFVSADGDVLNDSGGAMEVDGIGLVGDQGVNGGAGRGVGGGGAGTGGMYRPAFPLRLQFQPAYANALALGFVVALVAIGYYTITVVFKHLLRSLVWAGFFGLFLQRLRRALVDRFAAHSESVNHSFVGILAFPVIQVRGRPVMRRGGGEVGG